LVAKRLEHGRFRFPQTEAKQELSLQVFQLLLDGIALGGRPCLCYVAAMTVEEQAATLCPVEIAALVVENADLKRQVEWCKRPLFGQKSERRLREPDPQQLSFSGLLTSPTPAADHPPPPTETVTAYQRRVRWSDTDLSEESALRFAPSVPVQAIVLSNPAVADLPPEAYEGIGEKVT
jgi:hypothetical protein